MIFQNWKEYWADRKEKATASRRKAKRVKIVAVMTMMCAERNEGLLIKYLMELPNLAGNYHTVSGLRAYCDLTMDDGFTIAGRGMGLPEAILDAAEDIVERLDERFELGIKESGLLKR